MLEVTEEIEKLDMKESGHWAFDIGIEIFGNKDKKSNEGKIRTDKKEQLSTKDDYEEKTMKSAKKEVKNGMSLRKANRGKKVMWQK